MEEQLVVQFPWAAGTSGVQTRLREAIARDSGCDVDVEFVGDASGADQVSREIRLTVPGVGTWSGTLCDLPCIVESHRKRTNGGRFFKSANISQMLALKSYVPPAKVVAPNVTGRGTDGGTTDSSAQRDGEPPPRLSGTESGTARPGSSPAPSRSRSHSARRAAVKSGAADTIGVDTAAPEKYPHGLTPPAQGIRTGRYERLHVPSEAEILDTLRLLEAISNRGTVEEFKLGYLTETYDAEQDVEEDNENEAAQLVGTAATAGNETDGADTKEERKVVNVAGHAIAQTARGGDDGDVEEIVEMSGLVVSAPTPDTLILPQPLPLLQPATTPVASSLVNDEIAHNEEAEKQQQQQRQKKRQTLENAVAEEERKLSTCANKILRMRIEGALRSLRLELAQLDC